MGQAYNARISTLHDGNIISAALFNNEYNAILNAFSTTGHQHDGTAGEGGAIHTIGDSDFLNKIVIESNEIKFFIEVSGGTVEQLNLVDGVLAPETDNDIDLGTSSKNFKAIYAKSLDINGAADISGALTGMSSLNVSGTATATGLDINGAADISGALTGLDSINVGGLITGTSLDINGAADISGALTGLDSINVGGSITGTSLDINGAADISGALTGLDSINVGGSITGTSLDINGAGDISGALTGMSSLNVSGTATATGLDINGNGDISGNLVVDTTTLTVDSSNNRVGVGTASPTALLHVESGNSGVTPTSDTALFIEGSSHCDLQFGTAYTGNARINFGRGSTPGGPADPDQGQILYNAQTNYMTFTTNNSERVRVDSSGKMLVGLTSTSSSSKLQVNGDAEASGFNALYAGSIFLGAGNQGSAGLDIRSYTTTTSFAQSLMRFSNSSNSTGGSITISGATVAYNTSSDERLKENIKDAEDAGDKIDAIKIRQFDWKEGGEHQDYGVIAQELDEVAPEAVTKGATEDDMMSVDYSKLVPTLIKEIQSLRNRVAELEKK